LLITSHRDVNAEVYARRPDGSEADLFARSSTAEMARSPSASPAHGAGYDEACAAKHPALKSFAPG